MIALYHWLVAAHVAAGLMGLAAFWVPTLTRKGGRRHRRWGRVFVLAAGLLLATGTAMSTLGAWDPMAIHPPTRMLDAEGVQRYVYYRRVGSVLAFYLIALSYGPIYHGVRVLETRAAHHLLRTPFHTSVGVAMMALGAVVPLVGLYLGLSMFVFLGLVGLLGGWGMLAYARRPPRSHMAWWYEHMGSMLGGGIAFHTGFLVFGFQRLSGIDLQGWWALVPWLLPSLVGIPATEIWVRRYRRRFERADRPGSVTAGRPLVGV